MPDNLAGAATRLQKQQRGWFFDPARRFMGLRGAFARAAKTAAFQDVLRKFGLDRGAQMVDELTRVYQNGDFGLRTRDKDKFYDPPENYKRKGILGPPAGLGSGDAADRVVPAIATSEPYGGV
jgi:hypothetical protein